MQKKLIIERLKCLLIILLIAIIMFIGMIILLKHIHTQMINMQTAPEWRDKMMGTIQDTAVISNTYSEKVEEAP